MNDKMREAAIEALMAMDTEWVRAHPEDARDRLVAAMAKYDPTAELTRTTPVFVDGERVQ